MSAEFEIRDYQTEDESPVLALIQEGMGGGQTGTRDKTFWQWKHFDNPFGQSISLVAESHTGDIIGLRTFMRWRFKAANTTINAVRAVDTVTHPEYRRYGVFSALTRRAVEQVKQNGIDMIYNTPNDQVLPGYLKLGWNYVSLIRPMVKVINYPRFIAALVRSRNKPRASGQISPDEVFKNPLPTINEFLSDKKAVGQLLDSQSKNPAEYLCTDRFPDYLKWRYADHPYVDYRVLYSVKNGVFSGCIVLRPSTRFGLKEVVIDELLFSKPDGKEATSLLRELRKNINADYVIAYFARDSFQRHILRRNGFYQVPAGGQNYTVNVLNSNLAVSPLALENWRLTLGDLEMF